MNEHQDPGVGEVSATHRSPTEDLGAIAEPEAAPLARRAPYRQGGRPPPLTTTEVISLQRIAGNTKVARYLERTKVERSTAGGGDDEIGDGTRVRRLPHSTLDESAPQHRQDDLRTPTSGQLARQSMDPRHARGHAGEQGMGFEHYPQEDGWILIEGPSGAAGHGVTTKGFDAAAYNAERDELHLTDNKSLKAAGNVKSATALTRNLRKNLDGLIARVEAARDIPRRVRILDLLRQARAALTAKQPLPNNVKLVVTGVGGQSTGVTKGLRNQGVEFLSSATPQVSAPGPPPTSAATQPPTSASKAGPPAVGSPGADETPLSGPAGAKTTQTAVPEQPATGRGSSRPQPVVVGTEGAAELATPRMTFRGMAVTIGGEIAVSIIVDLINAKFKQDRDQRDFEAGLRTLSPDVEREKQQRLAALAHRDANQKLYFNIHVRVTSKTTTWIAGRGSGSSTGPPNVKLEHVSISPDNLNTSGPVADQLLPMVPGHAVLFVEHSQLVTFSVPLPPPAAP
jgi:hypothetical protein